MFRATALALFAACLSMSFTAQAQLYPELKAYESCAFPDGLEVTEVTPMPPDVKVRPVQSHGKTGSVPLLAGRRVTLSYPGETPYASVKVELLPAENFVANRQLILDDFDDILASDKGTARNATHKPTQNGFTITGLDRKELKGNTLGIYLLTDKDTHIVATIYLLNQDPAKRKFQALNEYAHVRDTFLYNYTRCVRNNQTGSTFGVTK